MRNTGDAALCGWVIYRIDSVTHSRAREGEHCSSADDRITYQLADVLRRHGCAESVTRNVERKRYMYMYV